MAHPGVRPPPFIRNTSSESLQWRSERLEGKDAALTAVADSADIEAEAFTKGVEAAKDAELRSAMPNLPFDVVDDVAPLEAAVPSGGSGGGKSRRTD